LTHLFRRRHQSRPPLPLPPPSSLVPADDQGKRYQKAEELAKLYADKGCQSVTATRGGKSCLLIRCSHCVDEFELNVTTLLGGNLERQVGLHFDYQKFKPANQQWSSAHDKRVAKQKADQQRKITQHFQFANQRKVTDFDPEAGAAKCYGLRDVPAVFGEDAALFKTVRDNVRPLNWTKASFHPFFEKATSIEQLRPERKAHRLETLFRSHECEEVCGGGKVYADFICSKCREIPNDKQFKREVDKQKGMCLDCVHSSWQLIFPCL
jgi:hypothetical protein